jgi:hypothetical protein
MLILNSVKSTQKNNRSQKTKRQEKTERCLTLAYAYAPAPLGLSEKNGPDITIVIAKAMHELNNSRASGQMELGEGSDVIKKAGQRVDIFKRVYFAKLNPRIPEHDLSDVEGTFGLIGGGKDDPRSISFERLLADLLIRELEVHTFSEGHTVVAIQGPLIPKLRGRLLYRSISERLSLFAVTWDPQIVNRMESARHLITSLRPDPNSRVNLSNVYPSRQVDRATRHWVATMGNGDAAPSAVHFEGILDPAIANWESTCKSQIGMMMDFDARISNAAGSNVPDLFSAAHEAALRHCDAQVDFQKYLLLLRSLGKRKPFPSDFIDMAPRGGLTIETANLITNRIEEHYLHLHAALDGTERTTDNVHWNDETSLYKAYFHSSH